MTVVGVVGGGAAGVLTVVQLAREWSGRPLTVVLYDAGTRPGRGVAYGTNDAQHLLNVPAGRMSAVADDPEHFLRWARSRNDSVDAEDYLPRCTYGDYLTETLADHAPSVGLLVRRTPVSDIIRSGTNMRVVHRDGVDVLDGVVLAVGHTPPVRPAGVVTPYGPGYVGDPWLPGALADLQASTCPGDVVLTIGSGLTAVDVALSLTARGRRVIMVSRTGLLPERQVSPRPSPLPLDAAALGAGPLTVARLESVVRRHVRDAQAAGQDWRSAVDGLRPVTAAIWARLPQAERAAFLAGPARRWEVLRHRMAPQVAASIDRMMRRNQLVLCRGEIMAAIGEERSWRITLRRPDSLPETMRVAGVVNCTGPTCDIGRAGALGAQLLERGLVVRDPLGLGIRTDEDGAVVDADGRADGRLLTLGTMRRGSLYESTAVPELREQAATIARRLGVLLNADPYPRAGTMTGCDSRSSSTSRDDASSSSAAGASPYDVAVHSSRPERTSSSSPPNHRAISRTA